MKKIIYILLFIVLLLSLALNIFSFNETSFFGFRIYKVGSGSMKPYLNINDIIIIKNDSNYKLNDIVTYQDNNEYITHRIISINNNDIITKGDANNIQDNPITKDKIIGKLIYKFQFLSFISYLLSKPLSWLLLFVLGLIIVYLIPDKENKN